MILAICGTRRASRSNGATCVWVVRFSQNSAGRSAGNVGRPRWPQRLRSIGLPAIHPAPTPSLVLRPIVRRCWHIAARCCTVGMARAMPGRQPDQPRPPLSDPERAASLRICFARSLQHQARPAHAPSSHRRLAYRPNPERLATGRGTSGISGPFGPDDHRSSGRWAAGRGRCV